MGVDAKIIEYLSHGVNKFKALVAILSISKKELQAILDHLILEQKVYYDSHYDSYYALKEATLHVKPAGYAFASVIESEEEYYISYEDLGPSYDGDIALVYPYEKGSKLVNARVYKIIKRAHTRAVGILKIQRNKFYYVESRMKSFQVRIEVFPRDLNMAKPGNIVEVDISYRKNMLYGKVISILGHIDDPGIEISEIAAEYGFKTPFDEATIQEVEMISDIVLEEEKIGRRNFTNKNIITIDGEDSKDFDDAVYASKLENGNYQLEVYIADVAHYVKEGSFLDKEAFERGTSVYLADRVIPMLPRKLSNGICSLNEGVPRLVLACIMELDLKGNLVNYDICEGIICSKHRMTYKKVNEILNGDKEACEEYEDIVDMLVLMKEISSIIRQRRYKKGGLEFEVDEYKVNLNEDGSPKEITLRIREDAEKLIEDFMLQANETVSYHLNIMNLPCVYRIHEKPDQEKLHTVFGIIMNMGISLKKTQNDIHPKLVQEALFKISDSKYAPILNHMLLRSMMKAKYHEKCLGHYGLAMNYYCHFTSPIRRYPDLMVHRILKRLLLHPQNLEEDIFHFETILPEVCVKTSASERRSVECEREVEDMLYAWYMSKHIQEVFDGIITSITSFGMFVTLENGIEGLVSFRDMDGYFDVDENSILITSEKRSFKLGDKVKVVVLQASKERRKIDFMLEEDYNEYIR